ncbi:MAG: hypothetical protein QM683_11185 [Lacrimispora sp.]
MMKKKAFLICAVSAFLLTGCTQSHILATGAPAEPVFETQDGMLWTGAESETTWMRITDSEDYPMALSINCSLDPETNTWM